MIRRTSTILLVSLVLCAFLASVAFAAHKGNDPAKTFKSAKQVATYSFPDEHDHGWATGSSYESGRVPLGTMTSTAAGASPGQTVGYTYYDYQHNCSMGRMVEIGPHSGETGTSTVHFGWMHLPGDSMFFRTYMYNSYKSADGLFSGAFRLHSMEEEYSGYVNVDVTPDNRALVGGHSDTKGPVPYQAQIHYDFCTSCNLFDAFVRVPDSLSTWLQEDGSETTWPKFFFQFGTDTVLHIVAQNNTDNRTYNQTIMYFRQVGYEGSPEAVWDYPPYLVDSVPIIAHDITGERLDDRVCMAWFANLEYPGGIESPTEFPDADNNMWLEISDDQGQTWAARQNLTGFEPGDAGFKAWCDCSILFDQSSNCHILFHTIPWAEDPCLAIGEDPCMEGGVWQAKSRLMHWSENVPYVRTVADHSYEPSDSCGVPAFASHVAKMGLGECDGKLYAMWSQFNDIPNGIDNDCAEWVYTLGGWQWGGLNAEIWVSVSEDGGMTWDAQRNLTNSYTPHCDPLVGDDCQSDYWGTISRWGKQVEGGEDWSGAVSVDPSGGSSPTDWFLDIMYVNDLDAGGIVHQQGSWTNNPLKWFRLPCVEPEPAPKFVAGWLNYGDPSYQSEDTIKNVPLDFENAGNVVLTFDITVGYAIGDPGGWLSHAYFGNSVPSGLDNIVTGDVILNSNGLTTGNYNGHMAVTGNDPALPDTIWVEMIVADTVCPVDRDVINGDVISLVVSNYGNFGNDGQETVNMDFYPEDCDSTAKVYLYDGSPFIGRGSGADAIFYHAVWQTTWLDDYGFRPQCGHTPNEEPCSGLGDAEVYESGTFSTQDSTIAIEKIWLIPPGDVTWIIQYMKVWSFDGNPHDDVMIGEIIDWDIPWDYLAVDPELDTTTCNSGHIDGPRGLLYMQGYEAYGANADTGYPYNCQYNDARFGGEAFIESYLDGSFHSGGPDGGFCGENDDLVYNASEGFEFEPFYDLAVLPGLSGTTAIEDLFGAMVFETALDMVGTTVYEVVKIMVVIQEGSLGDLQAAVDEGKAWYHANGGMTMFEDLDDSGTMDICEGCCVVMGDFNHDGGYNPLDAAAFVNWMWRSGPAPFCLDECDVNCSGAVDPLDAAHMVAYFWGGGPPPCTCAELP